MTDIEFLPPRHPAQRINPQLKAGLIRTQQETLDRSFSSADSFCRRLLTDLKLDIPVPESLRDEPVKSIADLPFSKLASLFNGFAIAAGIPESAAQVHAFNIALRAQLLRAFDDPDHVLEWAVSKITGIVAGLPISAGAIEVGRNPGDVLDPYLFAATQSLLCKGDLRQAVSATVAHKALMILEGLLGHLHEEIVGRMRGNLKTPETRTDNAEALDLTYNPFPGADVVQPPSAVGEPLRLHQVKSKTGTLNSSGGKRLAEQMRALRMTYPGTELYSHSLVGNTLRGHRAMGGMLRVEPQLVILVGDASFKVLTGSENGAELLLRLYQTAFHTATKAAGYSITDMATAIFEAFRERANAVGEDFLESVLHRSNRGDPTFQDSRTYPRRSPDRC